VNSRFLVGFVASLVLSCLPASAARVDAGGLNTGPDIAKVDHEGRPLVGMVLGGTSCTKFDGDPQKTCISLSDYPWVDMSSTALLTSIADEIVMERGSGTDCSTSTHWLTFWEEKAPEGYDLAPGEIVICQIEGGWMVESNTSGGAITFTPARITKRKVTHAIVTFHDSPIVPPSPPSILTSTTTSVAPTTTTSVVPTTTAVGQTATSVASTLPATGAPSARVRSMSVLALFSLAVGGALVAIGRRRSRPSA